MTPDERANEYERKAREWMDEAERAQEMSKRAATSADRRVWDHHEAGARAQHAYYVARAAQTREKRAPGTSPKV